MRIQWNSTKYKDISQNTRNWGYNTELTRRQYGTQEHKNTGTKKEQADTTPYTIPSHGTLGTTLNNRAKNGTQGHNTECRDH
jgi:hypothetical protein